MTAHDQVRAAAAPDPTAEPPPHDPVGLPRLSGVALMVLGALGFVGAFMLAVDKYRILEDPSFSPGCDLNPVLSCGTVMVTEQASRFGFPNPLIGVATFPVVVALGLVLATGTRLPRWVLGGLAGGGVAGAVFVHWLAYQSLYRIDALCPWCLLVWAVTLPIALWTVLGVLRATVPGRSAEGAWGVRYLLLLGWYLVFVVAILERFWDYWSTLL